MARVSKEYCTLLVLATNEKLWDVLTDLRSVKMKKWYIIAGILIVLLLTTGCIVMNSPPAQAGKLEVITHSMTGGSGSAEYAKVRATVKNVGSNTIELAEVMVKFYDANGVLIETAKDAVMNLKPGESWTFTFPCSGAGCDKIVSYSVETLAGASAGGLPK